MDEKERIEFSLEHIAQASVFSVHRKDWEKIVTGEPTILEQVPDEISGLLHMASTVVAAGSGIYNPSPGIDVIRYHEKDYPKPYNIYHYDVYEHFTSDPVYFRALQIAGVHDNHALRETLDQYVFVVGFYYPEDHHSTDIPQSIQNAMIKNKKDVE